MEEIDTQDLVPQERAILAAGAGKVIVKTNDGKHIALTPMLAEHIAAGIVKMARLAQGLAQVELAGEGTENVQA